MPVFEYRSLFFDTCFDTLFLFAEVVIASTPAVYKHFTYVCLRVIEVVLDFCITDAADGFGVAVYELIVV